MNNKDPKHNDCQNDWKNDLQNDLNNNSQNKKDLIFAVKIKKFLKRSIFVLICLITGFFIYKTSTKFASLKDLKLDQSLKNNKFTFSNKENELEFLYKLTLKNQIQLDELKQEIKIVKEDINKYKKEIILAKAMVTFQDLKNCFYSNEYNEKNCLEIIDKLKELSVNDKFLQDQIKNIELALKEFKGVKNIKNNFNEITHEILLLKEKREDFLSKFFDFWRKFIEIRKINNINDNHQKSIREIELLIENKKFIEAKEKFEIITKVNKKEGNSGKKILSDRISNFAKNLNNAAKLADILNNINNYIKNV